MKHLTFSETRKNLARAIDEAARDHVPVLITRGAGKPAAVLMSLEDFASYQETRYLLSSPKNAERLRAAMMTPREDMVEFESLEDLKDALGI